MEETYELVTTSGFDMAHRLHTHKGKCQKIHGHFYKLEVGIIGTKNNESQMVIDFYDFKKIVREIADSYDHKFLVYTEDKLLHDTMNSAGFEIKVSQYEVTVENIAKNIFNLLESELPIKPSYVKLWETEGNAVVYRRK